MTLPPLSFFFQCLFSCAQILVDMIRVPDWAFEAAGQEMRSMNQDAATYHPGLYLTPAQASPLLCSNYVNHLVTCPLYPWFQSHILNSYILKHLVDIFYRKDHLIMSKFYFYHICFPNI